MLKEAAWCLALGKAVDHGGNAGWTVTVVHPCQVRSYHGERRHGVGVEGGFFLVIRSLLSFLVGLTEHRKVWK